MRVVHKFGAALLLLLVSLLLSPGAYPQGGATGAIAGSVLDTTGAAISGAEVQIVNTGTEEMFLVAALGQAPVRVCTADNQQMPLPWQAG